MRIPITLKTIPMRFWNTLFLLACLPSLGLGQVVINEFSCSNYTSNHAEQVETQLARQPKARPVLEIVRKPDSVYGYRFEDFVLQGYDPEPNISAPVAI